MGVNTILTHSGRGDQSVEVRSVNPVVMRASTILFKDYDTWQKYRKLRATDRVLSYGARGTTTNFELEKLVCELEGGYRAHEAGFDEAGSEEFTADNQGDHAYQNLAHAFEEELEGGENIAEITQADQLKDDRNDGGDNHCRDNIHTDMTAGDFGEENDQEERDDGQNGVDFRDLFVLFSGLRTRQRLNIVGIKNPAFTLVPPALDEHVNERQDNDHTDKEGQLVIDEVF